MTDKQPKPNLTLAVWRCAQCGDTFPTDANGPLICPTCGGSCLEPAAEPFL